MARYSNEDCEIAALRGKIEGLKNHLTKLLELNSNQIYRGTLSTEISRVNKELQETETTLSGILNSKK